MSAQPYSILAERKHLRRSTSSFPTVASLILCIEITYTYTRYTENLGGVKRRLSRLQLEEYDENDRVMAVTRKKRSVHLRRNISLSLYTSFISLCTGGPPAVEGARGGRETWEGRKDEKNSREVAKKNAKENANRPLDITGEMLPDLSRFYLVACL